MTGRWVARQDLAEGGHVLTLVLVQSGMSVVGRLQVAEAGATSDAAGPATVGAAGEFLLDFGHAAHRMTLEGRPDARGERLFVTVRRPGMRSIALVFARV